MRSRLKQALHPRSALGTGVEGSAVNLVVNAWMTASTVAMSDVLALRDALAAPPFDRGVDRQCGNSSAGVAGRCVRARAPHRKRRAEVARTWCSGRQDGASSSLAGRTGPDMPLAGAMTGPKPCGAAGWAP
ncbi:hypothetical protein OG936_34760 [Streptomyces sp. NBC_00846]|uniref:hypothetical protein n=1 Tax=Streptomyces sp. NBC_00846 TaxID=2975849 RepID=UPI00386F19DE|nr:hypothetical protein OG936_34760 [Streptomyces sp. NBC_00846]